MENIKFILWDIDRTLLDFEYSEKEGLNLTFKQFGYDRLDENMLSDYKIINDKYWDKFEKGEVSKQEVLEGRFMDFFDLYGYDKSIVPTFNHEYQKNMGTVVSFLPNAKETVTKLKEHYKQYAATNGTALAQKKKMEASGLDKLLDGYFISEEMGVNKPYEEYFDKGFGGRGSHNKNEESGSGG
jgi:FMN phosphatase YigB (HAD superfamily)